MQLFRRTLNYLSLTILALGLLASCVPVNQSSDASPQPTALPVTQQAAISPAAPTASAPTAQPTAEPPSPTPAPPGVAALDGLPQPALAEALRRVVTTIPEITQTTAEPDLTLNAEPVVGSALLYERIWVPVVRFPSPVEEISFDQLKEVWAGTSSFISQVHISETSLPELEALLGTPGPGVHSHPADSLADAIWDDTTAIGLVPFEALVPRLRAVRIGQLSAVDNRLDQTSWPLATRIWASAGSERGRQLVEQLSGQPPVTNRDPNKLTVLVMTGVTAMARGTAAAIERAADFGFPARVVGPELAAADLTIISNEIPFVEGCEARDILNNLILCSRPEYFESLALSGVDAVGLTGNHQNDFGYENMLSSLDFYREKGIPVYGGGANEEEAKAPLVLEHNGNRLAFLGANQWGPEYYWPESPEQVSAWAGVDTPGSARFDPDQMAETIKAAAPGVDLVFAELQHTEFNAAGEYQAAPLASQMQDFRALREAGATVVTGVQAHAPQAVELDADGIILYGLGNLYFDQTWSWETRTGLIPRHAIYDGRLLNTELLVSILEMDMQQRWATPEERTQVLSSIYAAGGY